jgi:hypothetical protein
LPLPVQRDTTFAIRVKRSAGKQIASPPTGEPISLPATVQFKLPLIPRSGRRRGSQWRILRMHHPLLLIDKNTIKEHYALTE